MESSSNPSSARAEAERSLSMAEKLLLARDLVGSRNFAHRARQHDPNLDGIDQVLAVADVLLAAEKRANSHMDWYAILQLNPHSHDLDSMKKQYHRLARVLHPDRNRRFGADGAFKLVVDAWAVLSDPARRSLYDKELNIALDLNKSMPPPNNSKPSTTIHSGGDNPDSTIWTACPYCCNLYEYAKDYENCRLRCQNCKRGFQAAAIQSLPPIVPGMDAYYCSWGFFPLGVWGPNSQVGVDGSDGKSGENIGFSSWKPFLPMYAGSVQPGETGGMSAGQQDCSMNVPSWNGSSAGEGGSREKAGAAGVSMPKGRTNEEPLLAVPISVRAPKKKAAKKAKKEISRKARAENLAKESMQDSSRRESSANVGENMETERNVGDASMGAGHSEKADDFQAPVEKVGEAETVEIRGENTETDPVDIPSLLKLLGVKDDEMNAPFNDFGNWDK
eukprot:TRINITY_DN34931_c0_g1_i1.p1 TRINITY_DN34931_c0_g1~~TRINITY_DN34931_c0_g1_i1.p1  ORF type:complete len:447 (+),score=81.17 TRINITY_DN34931_c0_g1_i1:963-2303(+)